MTKWRKVRPALTRFSATAERHIARRNRRKLTVSVLRIGKTAATVEAFEEGLYHHSLATATWLSTSPETVAEAKAWCERVASHA